MKFLLIVLVIVAIGLALAWWSSGRSRSAAHHERTARERGDDAARTMGQYRPSGNGNAPGGGFGGGTGPVG